MEILGQIGINQTAFIQFLLFIISITILSKFVFKDFSQLISKRQENTKGGEELALEIHKKSTELTTHYELKAKELHSEIKWIMDSARHEANKNYDEILNKARQQAQNAIGKNQKEIEEAVLGASKELKTQAPILAMSITNKLLGK